MNSGVMLSKPAGWVTAVTGAKLGSSLLKVQSAATRESFGR